MKLASWMGFVLGLVMLFVWAVYCLVNRAGHSGFDPLVGSKLFLVLFIGGMLCVVLSSGRALSAWFLSAIGVSGACFGLFVHKLNILQDYTYWVKHGLLEKNPNTLLLILSYQGGVLLLFVLMMTIFKKVSAGHRKKGKARRLR